MDNKEWLQSLKSGDKFCTLGYLGRNYNIYTVKRITNTMIITEYLGDKNKDGTKFNRRSGTCVGTSQWHSETAQELTPEIIHEINKARCIYKLDNFSFSELDEEILKQVYDLVFKKG